MVSGMALALNGARTTDHDTRFESGADDAEVDLGLTSHDAADGVADIGAVEIEADRPDQLQHVRLA
jgi:hypothetical protein